MPKPRTAIECNFCSAKPNCVLHTLADDVELLDRLKTTRLGYSVAKNELLIHAGDAPRGIWMLCSGRIKVYTLSEDHKPLISRIVSPGELFGHEAFFADEPSRIYAEAIQPATAAIINERTLNELFLTSPALAARFVRFMAQELQMAQLRSVRLAYSSARQRILEALQQLHTEHSETVRLRRQDLAELTGLTIETTVRTLKQIERDGGIEIRGREIAVLEPQPYSVAA